MQRITKLEYSVKPADELSEGVDGFGNRYIFGRRADEHRTFDISVWGEADTCIEIYSDECKNEAGAYIFTLPTRFTAPGKELKRFFAAHPTSESDSNYTRALSYMRALYHYFSYQSGVTDINTTAEDAMRKRQGVCQDFAHIMIALCRMAGIPARYTVMMMIGEGESHACVEILSGGKWYGFDPTNNLLVDGLYVKVSHGRDYSDCLIDRGIFYNPAKESQRVRVEVKRIRGA